MFFTIFFHIDLLIFENQVHVVFRGEEIWIPEGTGVFRSEHVRGEGIWIPEGTGVFRSEHVRGEGIWIPEGKPQPEPRTCERPSKWQNFPAGTGFDLEPALNQCSVRHR
jgi:hypothetical protein